MRSRRSWGRGQFINNLPYVKSKIKDIEPLYKKFVDDFLNEAIDKPIKEDEILYKKVYEDAETDGPGIKLLNYIINSNNESDKENLYKLLLLYNFSKIAPKTNKKQAFSEFVEYDTTRNTDLNKYNRTLENTLFKKLPLEKYNDYLNDLDILEHENIDTFKSKNANEYIKWNKQLNNEAQ